MQPKGVTIGKQITQKLLVANTFGKGKVFLTGKFLLHVQRFSCARKNIFNVFISLTKFYLN